METVPKLNLNIPDHTILDKIGEGGMSAVYLGRQISLQRKVAIKVLKKLVMDDKTLAERFVDEAKTVASLDHPHIISIYEAKKLPSGLAYFTMPYLTHGDFGEIICTNSDHLIELLCQICDGLSHAHQHGIIHRDLKPDNILFDQFGRIKIADFGIAISKNGKRKTKESQLLGSAHYMSPEQIQSKEVDRQSDVYSLGCIIYEKLTGEHAFEGGNDFSVLMSHINKPIPQLPDALQEWQPIIDTCLAKSPKDRYHNVEALKDELLAIKYNKSTNKPAQQKTTSKPETKPPYFRLAAIAASLLVLASGLLLFTKYKSSTTKTQVMPQTYVEPPIVQSEEPEPLAQDVSVAEPTEIEAELVDLSADLDNEALNEMSVEAKLEEAQKLLRSYRLTKPKGENAADKFQAILLEQPDNQIAKNGLNQVGEYYFELIEKKIDEQDFAAATKHITSLLQYIDNYNIDRSLFDDSVGKIMTETNRLMTQATRNRRFDSLAESYLNLSQLLLPDDQTLQQLQTDYRNIPQSGQLFKDQLGHDFVYFTVNDSPSNDFMMGTHEVTVAQFARFAGQSFAEDKCHHYDKTTFFKKTWLKPPFEQAQNHPVVCITAAQASAYATWLSEQTGGQYRLPTQQEFNYVNQQLNQTNSCQSANLAGSEANKQKKATKNKLNCSDGHVFTAPVATFKTKLEIADFNGNVSEWIAKCGSRNACAAGNSWRSGQASDNQATLPDSINKGYSHIGFRLVKTL